MPWSLLEIPGALSAYALVLFRLTGLALTAPIYASSVMPGRLRAALVMTIAALMFPVVGRQAPGELTLVMLLVGGVGELAIGLTIGLGLSLFVMAMEIGGLMIGQQAGIAVAQTFDPTRNVETSILGQVYTIVLMTLFLVAGGHRATMAALLDTFKVIPLLSFRFEESVVMMLVEMLTAAFILGIRIAGPVLIALFLMGTAMGFLSRTMPQFNILSVGFTLRVLVTMGVAGFALVGCEEPLLDGIWDALSSIRASLGVDSFPVGLAG
ncbi:MAG: flagellar biosynthetic protein FliR [Planctomycetes bacterium]|nr:flagellar biosynthetic protein FliR [Planctomycetota bacterium]